ncbi:mechanosensitive ion channel family protein, partial [Synechococcus lacustris Cruz CV12-2]|nr:mechanosensitive ion channel family protein [Synechococcus lacustris Cruz CV12-2]
MPLLVALLATQLLVAAPLTRAADAPSPAFIKLDGRRVLEIRVAAGTQTPAQLARVASQRLAELAANYSIQPEQIVLQEDPPYTTIGVMRGEIFEPR